MKTLKLALFVLFAFSSLPVIAQDAALTSPVVQTQAKYKVRSFLVENPPVGSPSALVIVSSQDSGNSEIATIPYRIPDPARPSATFAGLSTAMVTVRATETGSDARKLAFRILGYLLDNGYLPAVTLNP